MLRANDPLCMPRTGETPETRLTRGANLPGTPGEIYVQKRGIALEIAEAAGLRYDPDWNGRAAVIVAMRDATGALCSVHGRYLQHCGEENKMFTIGRGGGAISVGAAIDRHSIILVEGLFDALSLAECGYSSLATVGRWAAWLPDLCANKVVWLAFDGNRPGELEAQRYRRRLVASDTRRMLPPDRCKDWNTALLKRGRGLVAQWLDRQVGDKCGLTQ